MVSKGRTFQIMAMVGLALLIGCGKKAKERPQPASSFHGVWLNQELDGLYRSVPHNSDEFCAALNSEPARFGVSQTYRGKVTVADAYLINQGGEVLVYRPDMRQSDKTFRESNYKGYIDNNGIFVRRDAYGPNSPPPPPGNYHDNGYRPFPFWNNQSAKVVRQGDVLVVYANEELRNDVRTDEARVLNLYVQVAGCKNMRPHPSPGPGNGPGHGNGPGNGPGHGNGPRN